MEKGLMNLSLKVEKKFEFLTINITMFSLV